jgi:hypothetical protein
MSGSDDRSGEDPHLAQIAEEFERHCDELYERIADYMDEAEIGEAYVAQLLLEAMIRMRMEAYAIDVEKPSVAGLKLDLDRLQRQVDELVREAKKGAEDYIREVKKERSEVDRADGRAADGREDG